MFPRQPWRFQMPCNLGSWQITAPVGGLADVEFETVAAVGKRQVEGRECVFGDGAGSAGAAMAEQKRAGHQRD